jgi:hypothetical protein
MYNWILWFTYGQIGCNCCPCHDGFDANFEYSCGKMNSTTIVHINCKFLPIVHINCSETSFIVETTFANLMALYSKLDIPCVSLSLSLRSNVGSTFFVVT